MERYDVVVVGVGGMGSAALYHLARRGKRVLGLERFDLLHEQGSSHGLTRIIRLAYFEHPDYVPLLRRAYELWRELEAEAGEQLLHVTGIVEGGERILDGVLRSCAEHDLEHEVLDGAEVARAFPRTACRPRWTSCTSRTAASSSPSAASSRTSRARSRAARCCARASACSSGTEGENGVRVRTDRGDVEAERLVLTAGAWSTGRRAPPRRDGARPSARSLAWLQPTRPSSSAPSGCRSSTSPRRRALLRLPRVRHPGLQARPLRPLGARRRSGRDLPRADARGRGAAPRVRRALLPRRRRADGRAQDVPLRAVARRALPHRPPPGVSRVVVGAGFSGHGFKFCSVVGEILADLALDGATRTTSGSSASTASDARDAAKVRREGRDFGLCGREDSNLQGLEAQRDLNPPRLPVPPRPRRRSVGREAPRPARSSGRRAATKVSRMLSATSPTSATIDEDRAALEHLPRRRQDEERGEAAEHEKRGRERPSGVRAEPEPDEERGAEHHDSECHGARVGPASDGPDRARIVMLKTKSQRADSRPRCLIPGGFS